MAFAKRAIDVEIKLKDGFFKDDSNTVTIKNHRVSCAIRDPGGESMGIMQCAIFGLSEQLMNRLTGIGVVQTQNIGNEIVITTRSIDVNGKVDTGIAFSGIIQRAWADFSQQPIAMLNIIATGGLQFALDNVEGTSLEGDVEIETIMYAFAIEHGYTLNNRGVKGTISNAHFSGNTLDKIQDLARATGIQYKIDDTNKQITIFPSFGNADDLVSQIGPKTGMVGYPTFSENGIIVTCLYNRNIRNATLVELDSSIPSAKGKFNAYDVLHNIESENPDGGGQWFTTLRAFRENE